MKTYISFIEKDGETFKGDMSARWNAANEPEPVFDTDYQDEDGRYYGWAYGDWETITQSAKIDLRVETEPPPETGKAIVSRLDIIEVLGKDTLFAIRQVAAPASADVSNWLERWDASGETVDLNADMMKDGLVALGPVPDGAGLISQDQIAAINALGAG